MGIKGVLWFLRQTMVNWTQSPKEVTLVLPLPAGAKGKDIKQPSAPDKHIASIEEIEPVKAKVEPKKISVKLAEASGLTEADMRTATANIGKPQTESKLIPHVGKTGSRIVKSDYVVDGDPNFIRAWPYE